MNLRTFIFLVVTFAVLFVSCTSSMPEGVMDEDDMEKVLYDYHIAKAIDEGNKGNKLGDANSRSQAVSAVFEKYGITEEEFTQSIKWYSAHPEILFDIYKKMETDMPSNSMLAVSSGAGSDSSDNAEVDTVTLWSGSMFNILTTANNPHMSFTIKGKAENGKGKADRYIFKYTTEWYVREGGRNAIVGISIKYANDSTYYIANNSYGSGVQTIDLPVCNSQPVKIEGFIYISGSWSERQQILNVMSPTLYGIYYKSKTTSDITGNDSTRVDSGKIGESNKIKAERNLRDSLLKADSLQEHRPHFRN